MNATMQCLHKNFAEIGGLSDVLMVQALRILCKNKEFVQIISHSKCHWVAVTNKSCPSGTVHYYDSLH